MKEISLFTLLVLAFNFWSAPALAAATEKAETVSIVQLIATPEKYEDKLITIRGFVHLEFESNAIYLHKEDYEQSLYSNGLWLNARECKRIGGQAFDTGYAWVTARFTAKRHGHMGLWPGELQDVQDCSGWPPHRAGT